MITLRLDLDGKHSSEALTHELTHHDLTETTIAGKLEQLLARGADDAALGDDDRSILREVHEGLITRSMIVHESTATYAGALGERVTGREPLPIDELPQFYGEAVAPLLQILENPYAGTPVRFFANQMFAVSAARAALDSRPIVELIESRPSSREHLRQLFARINADRIYVRLVHELENAAVRAELDEVLRSLARERLGIADLGLLDERLVGNDEARISFVPGAGDLLIAALHRHLPELLGPYIPPAEMAAKWGAFVRHVQSSIHDDSGRAYFQGIEIIGTLESHSDVNFTYVFRTGDMVNMWRRVRAPAVTSVENVLRWLNDVAGIAGPRQLRVVLHSRELVNDGEQDQLLDTGDIVPPRGGIMHFDLQLDRVRADGTALTTDDVEALGAVAQSATARITSAAEENELFRTIEAMTFPVVWHAGWLIGLAAAHIRPNPFAKRPGVSVFYLDQSGATGKHFAWVLEHLIERGTVEITRAAVFEGPSDAYVLREGASYWSAVFPNHWATRMIGDFQRMHPGRIDAALEAEDAARLDSLVRYGLDYVYELARLRH